VTISFPKVTKRGWTNSKSNMIEMETLSLTDWYWTRLLQSAELSSRHVLVGYSILPSRLHPTLPAIARRQAAVGLTNQPIGSLRDAIQAGDSKRAKVAMKAVRRRDLRPRSVEALARTNAARQEAADAFADEVFPIIRELLKSGARTKTGIAEALNERGVSTPHGGKWYARTVNDVITRVLVVKRISIASLIGRPSK
jgi:hypothetical protein